MDTTYCIAPAFWNDRTGEVQMFDKLITGDGSFSAEAMATASLQQVTLNVDLPFQPDNGWWPMLLPVEGLPSDDPVADAARADAMLATLGELVELAEQAGNDPRPIVLGLAPMPHEIAMAAIILMQSKG